MTIRLMLVDDHKILRDALRAVLEHEADIALVAETDDPNKVISLAREHQPDIVVMDIGLPQTSGIEVTRHLLQELPTIKVLGLSTFRSAALFLKCSMPARAAMSSSQPGKTNCCVPFAPCRWAAPIFARKCQPSSSTPCAAEKYLKSRKASNSAAANAKS